MSPAADPLLREPSPRPLSKRSANSLLPAFEPFSSSPALPRPQKRSRDAFEENPMYPTPVPTSSTAILTSSPTRHPAIKPGLQRSLSTLSERAPLTTRPSIELDPDGKPTRLGRSSASSDYQLSANRLISRVHVVATYKPAISSLERDRVEVSCTGWNGVKIHCQGKIYEIKKGETFSSDIRDAEIMLDVHDSRVVLQWPEKLHLGPSSSDEEDSEESPLKRPRTMIRHSTPPSPSPAQTRKRLASPVSPSPAVQALFPSSPPAMPAVSNSNHVEIYEDPESAEDQDEVHESIEVTQSTQIISQKTTGSLIAQENSASMKLSHDFSDNDEENDPIVHSFGPFGANLLPRMASFTATSSPRSSTVSGPSSKSSHTDPLQSNHFPTQYKTQAQEFKVQDHVVNQLAFSRLSSTPLTTIWGHLPREEQSITKEELKAILVGTKCIGEVVRAGKDAAGKALESEYYYIPDQDEDEKRKEAVVNDLMKPGLRACRKQHKQYYWRKPK